MHPRSFRNSDHSIFLFLLILGIIKFLSFCYKGVTDGYTLAELYGSFPFWECASWGGKLPSHLYFKDRISRPLDFGDEGTFYPLIGRLVQIRFSVQGVSKSFTPSKDAVKHRSLYLKPVSQSATVVRTAPCDGGAWSTTHLPSHFTTADNSATCTTALN